MKKTIALCIAIFSLTAQADYIGGQTPTLMYGAGNIAFDINSPPSNLCTSWDAI